jgi:hypothetical protein
MSDLRQVEHRVAKHQAGQRAALVLELAEPRIAAREREVLDRACQQCRSGQLDALGALLVVTRLTELQDLRETLAHDVRTGNRELARLVGDEAS